MVIGEALGRTLWQFRPSKAPGYNGAVTYTRCKLTNCKLGQPTKGWTTDTAGAMRAASASLFWNVGHSGQEPALDPFFQEGDIISTRPALRSVRDASFDVQDSQDICGDRQGETPSDIEYTVRSVTEHTFKGVIHHYEVVLV